MKIMKIYPEKENKIVDKRVAQIVRSLCSPSEGWIIDAHSFEEERTVFWLSHGWQFPIRTDTMIVIATYANKKIQLLHNGTIVKSEWL